MQAANDLKVHLGWAVQIYNTAEALPNLINPFWMLPLLGVLGLKARDIVGFTFLQLLAHLPIVLFLLWLLGGNADLPAPGHPAIVLGGHCMGTPARRPRTPAAFIAAKCPCGDRW